MAPPKKRMILVLSVAFIATLLFAVLGLPLRGFSFESALAQVYGGAPEPPCGARDGRVNDCQPWQTAALYCRDGGVVEALYAVHLTPQEGSRLFLVTPRTIQEAASKPVGTSTLLATDTLGFNFKLYYFAGATKPYLLVGPGLGGTSYIFAFSCANR